MRIGILGGTGPPAPHSAARLASIGYEVGHRLAFQVSRDGGPDALVSRWPELGELLEYGDNRRRPTPVVVIATPWDSAATTAQENVTALEGKVVVSMANALVRVGDEFQPLVPPRGRWPRTCRRPCRAARRCRLPPPAGQRARQPRSSRSTRTCSSAATTTTPPMVAEIVTKIPGCRPLDAGELSNATAIEAFTAVLLQLNVRYKTRVAPKLTGIKRDPRQPSR